ncbi:beta lactamase induction signal transducer AmpG [Legionella beliardensis]|uniref:Beta lactamase induction signal transducer AmpG n=1 Tax=Legionella beliardensis TaxID=91822 RepID=A0A378I1U6_9GAMM|nr:MFS transporter [Legionella beliardensis]STX28690.1 beta lactamase induction signal transducer AmpG [Legionella beliardensis]
MNKRLLIVFLLGLSSGLPLALITSTLQAWFADSGMPILATGMLSLIGLPYLYKIVWGPLLDRYTLLSLGKRRSWILITQVCLFVGFNVMALLNPTDSASALALIALILAIFSATQDTAIDAHRVEYLPIKEHGLGASLAVFGYRLALLIAGGLALIMAAHIGWAMTYHIMGLIMGLCIIVTLWSQEPSVENQVAKPLLSSFYAPMKELLQRPKTLALLFFIFFYKLGEAFTATTSGIVMPFLIQGIGFSLDTIGYINKLLGISSILLGGLTAGLVLMRWPLYQALLCFGLLQALTNILFIALAMVGKNLALFAVAVCCDNFAAGMGSTALVALFMRLVNRQFTATQFAVLVAVSSLPRTFSGPIAALLQLWFGWVGLYQLSFLLALGFIPFLIMIKEHTKPRENDQLPFDELKPAH